MTSWAITLISNIVEGKDSRLIHLKAFVTCSEVEGGNKKVLKERAC